MSNAAAKRNAALTAVKEVADGMVVGLGTGSTAAVFVAALIDRVRAENLKIVGIPTSEKTAAQAKEGGIELSDFTRHASIDVTFDGADTADLRRFLLLKGLGGALLREKIVAQASKRLVIMVDESKIPDRFGGILPVEIVCFGHEITQARLAALAESKLRLGQDGSPFLTDNGNLIVDLTLPEIKQPETLQASIKNIAGVVETGLFIGLAQRIIVGTETGSMVYDKA